MAVPPLRPSSSAWNLATAPKHSTMTWRCRRRPGGARGRRSTPPPTGYDDRVRTRPPWRSGFAYLDDRELLRVPEGIGGAELARRAGRQAEQFGAELMFLRGARQPTQGTDKPRDAARRRRRGDRIGRGCRDRDGWRRLEIEGVDELLGRGVYYGAGRSEAPDAPARASPWSAPATPQGRL